MQDLIEKYHFKKAGDLLLRSDGATPFFKLESSFVDGEYANIKSWVYLWVSVKGGKLNEVFYVGKAGRTLKARCAQHQGGFIKSKTGQKHAEKIERFLNESLDNRLELHARIAKNGEVLDEEGTSLCEAEELAMITKLRRLNHKLWNKN